MIFKLEKCLSGYKCTIYDTLWPEIVFYGQTKKEARDQAVNYANKRQHREIYEQIMA